MENNLVEESIVTLNEEVEFYIGMRSEIEEYTKVADNDTFRLRATEYINSLQIFYEGLAVVLTGRNIDINDKSYEDFYARYVAYYFNVLDEILCVLESYERNGGTITGLEFKDVIELLEVNDILFIINRNLDKEDEKPLITDALILIMYQVFRALEEQAEQGLSLN